MFILCFFFVIKIFLIWRNENKRMEKWRKTWNRNKKIDCVQLKRMHDILTTCIVAIVGFFEWIFSHAEKCTRFFFWWPGMRAHVSTCTQKDIEKKKTKNKKTRGKEDVYIRFERRRETEKRTIYLFEFWKNFNDLFSMRYLSICKTEYTVFCNNMHVFAPEKKSERTHL